MLSGKVYMTFSVIGVVFLGLLLSEVDSSKGSTEEATAYEKQKGVCWVGQPKEISKNEIREVKQRGINWISQTPFGWQRSPSDTLINTETHSQTPWWGESKKGISITTALAQQHGIRTLLKPHLWVHESWPGEIEMQSEAEWKAWFRQYENFIIPYAMLADSIGIEILCIGTELHKTVKRSEWISVIKKIKAVYRGKLTYAANFSGEFEDVPFWEELDYIGVQAYFPLATGRQPALKELQEGWKDPLKRIEKIYKKNKRPVIFTELGYKSTPDAALEPWRWPEQNEEVCLVTQSNCYEAFFQTVWSREYIAGVYFWKWYPHSPRHSTDGDFTPQGKPAEQVMENWFSNQEKI